MSRYIHARSFGPPVERNYVDGRDRCDRALKKIFAAGPTMPGVLMKRDQSDASLNAALAKKLSRQERLRRSNAHEALEAVRKVHRAGGRRSLPEAQGDAPFDSKSVNMVKRARQHALHVNGHRLLSANELNKSFSQAPPSKRRPSALDYDYTFDERGRVLSKRLSARYAAKGLTSARPRLNDVGVTDGYGHGAPESLNSQWNDVHADTGATNNFRDMPVPSVRPTIVGSQTTATPSMLTRDAAIDAIKMALRKPQKLWGNASDLDEDEVEDLDEDDDDDDDEDSGTSNAKNPNRDDARR
jgi:hypothetical protein